MFKDLNNDYRLKIAFDFDDTLTNPAILDLARHLIRCRHDVWIMTARTSDEQYLEICREMNLDPSLTERNADLLAVAGELGIADKIIYTDCEDKITFFFDSKFDLLFDDSEWHCNAICEAEGMAIKV
ncbi:MAG: hypothetical protein LBR51_04435 [Bacteroidales bacterium]|jgi:hypothetical protein|nr:hypothetical protein [Bacteroidales bacterium]